MTDNIARNILEKFSDNDVRYAELEAALKVRNSDKETLRELADEYDEIVKKIDEDKANLNKYAARVVEIMAISDKLEKELEDCEKVIKGDIPKLSEAVKNNNDNVIVNKTEAVKKAENVVKKAKTNNKKISKKIDNMTIEELRTLCKEHNFKGYTRLSKKDLVKFTKEKLKEEKNKAKQAAIISPVIKQPVVEEKKDNEEEKVKKEYEQWKKDIENKPNILNAEPERKTTPLVSEDEQLFKNIDKFDDELNYKMPADAIKNAKNAKELAALGVSSLRIKEAVKNESSLEEPKKESKKLKVVDIKKVSKEKAEKIFEMLKGGKAKIVDFGTKALGFVKGTATAIKEFAVNTGETSKTNAEADKNFMHDVATNAKDSIIEKGTVFKDNAKDITKNAASRVAYETVETGKALGGMVADVGLLTADAAVGIKNVASTAANQINSKRESIIDNINAKKDAKEAAKLEERGYIPKFASLEEPGKAKEVKEEESEEEYIPQFASLEEAVPMNEERSYANKAAAQRIQDILTGKANKNEINFEPISDVEFQSAGSNQPALESQTFFDQVKVDHDTLNAFYDIGEEENIKKLANNPVMKKLTQICDNSHNAYNNLLSIIEPDNTDIFEMSFITGKGLQKLYEIITPNEFMELPAEIKMIVAEYKKEQEQKLNMTAV